MSDGELLEVGARQMLRRLGRGCALGIAAIAIALSACSLALDTSKPQCGTDMDCSNRGSAFAGTTCVSGVCVAASTPVDEGGIVDASTDVGIDAPSSFSCLGNNPTPKPQSGTATLDLLLQDFLQQTKPVTSVSVRACPNAADPQCTGGTLPVTPDAMGHAKVTIDLTQGAFTGFIAIDPQNSDGGASDAGPSSSDYMPTRIYYASTPLAADFSDNWFLASFDTFTLFSNIYKLKPPDPSLGIAIVVTQDCDHQDLAGASVLVDSLGPSTLSFYFVNDQPVTTATMTDSSGYVGFLNLPTGARRFTSSVGTRTVGSLTMYALPGTLSVAHLGPDHTP
jgi:hypothetical protein